MATLSEIQSRLIILPYSYIVIQTNILLFNHFIPLHAANAEIKIFICTGSIPELVLQLICFCALKLPLCPQITCIRRNTSK